MNTIVKTRQTRNVTEDFFNAVRELKNSARLKNSQLAVIFKISSFTAARIVRAKDWEDFCVRKTETAKVIREKYGKKPEPKPLEIPVTNVDVPEDVAVDIWRTKMDRLCESVDSLNTTMHGILDALNRGYDTHTNGKGAYAKSSN